MIFCHVVVETAAFAALPPDAAASHMVEALQDLRDIGNEPGPYTEYQGRSQPGVCKPPDLVCLPGHHLAQTSGAFCNSESQKVKGRSMRCEQRACQRPPYSERRVWHTATPAEPVGVTISCVRPPT